MLAFSTSRAISRPLEAVTMVAKRVSYSSDFTLQVPVTTSDEIGLLATSFNHLIQRVAAYTQELSQKNQQLQQATNELTTTLNTLQQTQAQLIQTEKMSSLGQMVAGVAHEINNPVGFIYGNLAYMNEYTQKLLELVHLYQQHCPQTSAEEIKEYIATNDLDFLMEDLPKTLDSMRVGTERLRDIVLELCNFSRVDGAKMKPVELHSGIDSTLSILQHRLKVHGEHPAIQVLKEYGELPLVKCYAGQMNQVFMNILSNAIDALDSYNTKRSTEQILYKRGTIRIRTQMLGSDYVRVQIADNGPGMTEQVRGRLFDPFFTTKPVGKGTGLGLSISYQIVVEKHGGALKCVSQPGQGAEFWIEIPVRSPKA